MVISMAPTILINFLILFTNSETSSTRLSTDPTPTTWPEQFHSTIIWQSQNKTQLDTLELWYDWTNGVSMSIVQRQLGKLLYGPEWNNGTSFRFTLDSSKECSVLQEGMVRPDWFRGAKYVGQVYMDDFLCNAWNVGEFMMYYEEVASKRPVAWKSLEGSDVFIYIFVK